MGTKLQELQDRLDRQMDNGEPVFPLLGRDPAAPTIIRTWALGRDLQIKRGERPASDMAQVMQALETAVKMEEWRKENDGAWRTGLFGEAQRADLDTGTVYEHIRRGMLGKDA